MFNQHGKASLAAVLFQKLFSKRRARAKGVFWVKMVTNRGFIEESIQKGCMVAYRWLNTYIRASETTNLGYRCAKAWSGKYNY